jgi:hypothetical protein
MHFFHRRGLNLQSSEVFVGETSWSTATIAARHGEIPPAHCVQRKNGARIRTCLSCQ